MAAYVGRLELLRRSIPTAFVGPGRIGLYLTNEGTSRGKLGRGWVVASALSTVSRAGTPIRQVRFRRQNLSSVIPKPASAQRIGGFAVPKRPAFYRLDVVFRDRSGSKIARYEDISASYPGV